MLKNENEEVPVHGFSEETKSRTAMQSAFNRVPHRFMIHAKRTGF